MASLELDYSALKSARGTSQIYYIVSSDLSTYYLYLFTKSGDAYHAVLTDPSDIADFVASLQPAAIEVDSPAQAAVLNSNSSVARPVQVFAPTGIAVPSTNDGRAISMPSLFPDSTMLYITGAADDPIAGRGQGSSFTFSSDTAGDTTLLFSFNDWVYLTGGAFRYVGATLGDMITLEATAPASTVTPNGGNTGNCNLTASPFGANTLIIPAAGNGAYDVNLTTAVPITALNTAAPRAPIGYWNWSTPDTGKGTITAGTPGASPYNLFTVNIDPLIRIVEKLQIVGDAADNLTIPAVNPKQFLPHWSIRATLHNSGHTGLQACFRLVLARVKTA